MPSVASQLIEEVTAHAQSDSLEDARDICADGTYFPHNLRTMRRNTESKEHRLVEKRNKEKIAKKELNKERKIMDKNKHERREKLKEIRNKKECKT